MFLTGCVWVINVARTPANKCLQREEPQITDTFTHSQLQRGELRARPQRMHTAQQKGHTPKVWVNSGAHTLRDNMQELCTVACILLLFSSILIITCKSIDISSVFNQPRSSSLDLGGFSGFNKADLPASLNHYKHNTKKLQYFRSSAKFFCFKSWHRKESAISAPSSISQGWKVLILTFCQHSFILRTRLCHSVWAVSQHYGNFKALYHHLAALIPSSAERICSSIRQAMKKCQSSGRKSEFLIL